MGWTMLQLAHLIAQTLNTIFYFLPNAFIVTYGEKEISSVVLQVFGALRFTMWNSISFLFLVQTRLFNLWVDKTGRPIGDEDGILMDAPWKQHWHLGIMWFIFEIGFLAAGGVVFNTGEASLNITANIEHLCRRKTVVRATVAFVTLLFVLYEAAALRNIYTSFEQLKKKSYNMFRWENILVRYFNLQVLVVETFVLFSFLVLSLVKIDHCGGAMLVLLGILPGQIATTALTVVNGYLMAPMRRGLHVLNVRHTIAWTESRVKAKWTGRGGFSKYRVPSYCFETTLKLWYFSLLAYRIATGDKEVTIESAMDLFELDEYDRIHIVESGVNVVIAWSVSKSIIVITFRGTSTAGNVMTDLRALPTILPPKTGRFVLGTMPIVHSGFLRSWLAEGLNNRVLNQVIRISFSEGFSLDTCHVMVTGHSMGGALAVLAAYDITRYTGVTGNNITCHTFGAPFVGNFAFKRAYDARIFDTWQVVNGDDMVPTVGGIIPVYSHVGKRVIVNTKGDIILNPLFIENTMARTFHLLRGTKQMTSHRMHNYRRSLQIIGESQFIKRKNLPGGIEGMKELMGQGASGVFRMVLNMNANEMKRLQRLGTFAWGNQLRLNDPKRPSTGQQEDHVPSDHDEEQLNDICGHAITVISNENIT